MTRYRYGGDAAAWLVELVTDVDTYAGASVIAVPISDIPVLLFQDANATVPAIDLQDSTFSALPVLTDPDGNPYCIAVPSGSTYVPTFYGPDDITTLYFLGEDGNAHSLLNSDSSDRLAAAEHDIDDLQIDVATLQAGGGGGGGGGMNYIRQQTAGTLGYPARTDLTTDTTWQGVDDPPIGVVSGQQGMLNGDHFERTPQLLI